MPTATHANWINKVWISLLSHHSSGPAQKMSATSSALDFFQLFVPDNAIQNMVTQTNMYAKKYQERFGIDEGWRSVTVAEMKSFLGKNISSYYIKHLA